MNEVKLKENDIRKIRKELGANTIKRTTAKTK